MDNGKRKALERMGDRHDPSGDLNNFYNHMPRGLVVRSSAHPGSSWNPKFKIRVSKKRFSNGIFQTIKRGTDLDLNQEGLHRPYILISTIVSYIGTCTDLHMYQI